jgi:hypothetical protein
MASRRLRGAPRLGKKPPRNGYGSGFQSLYEKELDNNRFFLLKTYQKGWTTMKYRKLPIIVEALQWTGDNETEMSEFMASGLTIDLDGTLIIPTQTVEGHFICPIGSVVIKGLQDEFYPCSAEIFAASYEVVDG